MAEQTKLPRKIDTVYVIEKPLANGLLPERRRHLLNRAPGLLAAAPRLFTLQNGTKMTIRGIEPDDAEIEQAFVRGLSARSRYLRFFSVIKELSPYMLEQFTHPCYPQNWALIATISDAGEVKEIGVARYAGTGPATSRYGIFRIVRTQRSKDTESHPSKHDRTIQHAPRRTHCVCHRSRRSRPRRADGPAQC